VGAGVVSAGVVSAFRDLFRRAGAPHRSPRVLGIGLLLVTAAIVGAQLLYPQDRPAPFTTADGIGAGNQTNQQLLNTLDARYQDMNVTVTLHGDKISPQTRLSDLGIIADNSQRVADLSYPWHLRLIPSSFLWAHLLAGDPSPEYARDQLVAEAFIEKTIDAGCSTVASDATIVASDATLRVTAAVPGRTCIPRQIRADLARFIPTLPGSTFAISGERIPADVSTADARKTRSHLLDVANGGVPMTLGISRKTIATTDLFSWLAFASSDGALDYRLDSDAVSEYLRERYPAEDGLTLLNVDGFISQLSAYLLDSMQPAATLTYIPDNGALQSVIETYVTTHRGTFGVSLRELGDTGRSASYLGDTAVTTASVYKLFVAYSTIKEVEAGTWAWTAGAADGHSVAECFDRMISLSDNECAEALLVHAGVRTVQADAQSLGATSTTFAYANIRSTPNDVALLLSQLATNQLPISDKNRTKWLTAMNENTHLRGIPAGLPQSAVANKPGFLGPILNDAAIIDSPTGSSYILVIMTRNASWGSLAELSRQIEMTRQ
jgi:beta-lactamase class A